MAQIGHWFPTPSAVSPMRSPINPKPCGTPHGSPARVLSPLFFPARSLLLPKPRGKREQPKAGGPHHSAWLLHLGLNPRANLPLKPHLRLLPQSVTPASIPIFFQPFLAAIVSPGRHSPIAWSQSSPSSHTGAVTRGSCLPVTSWVKVTPIPWLKAWPQLFNISMKPVKGYRYVK